MDVAFCFWLLSLAFCLTLHSADSESCTDFARIGASFNIPLKLAKETRLRWKHDKVSIYDSRSAQSSTYKVTAEGHVILPKVSESNAGIYIAEVFNKDGQANNENHVLCVLAQIQKPSVNITCDKKVGKVRLSCSVPLAGATQTGAITYEWLENSKPLNVKTQTLDRTYKDVSSKSFTCKVFNKVSHETSNPVQPTCNTLDSAPSPGSPGPPGPPGSKNTESEDDGLLLGLEFWVMIAILAGGGGLVLMLIIATCVCCSINRKKRKLRVKDEQEMRLHWAGPEQNYTNQRGHSHSANPAHPQGRSPRPNAQGQTAAGHTGPRPPRSRQNRPRPPDPITGQPLPGPRRTTTETGKTQLTQTMIGVEEENPPPLPQPRKTTPRHK